MALILDTNAISAAAGADPEVVKRFAAADAIAIPVIVLGEYRFGLSQSRYRKEHEAWLAGILERVLTLDIIDATTVHYADIRLELKKSGSPIPVNDLWIAALCRQHGYPLLSRDQHFDRVANLRRIAW